MRAGIGLNADEEERADTEESSSVGGSDFLLVETGGEEAALALGDILRIERIPRTRVERMGQTPVLRFEGSLLPLEDRAGILAGPAGPGSEMTDMEITVVVCRDGERHVGITVSQVLDVASGAPLTHAGTSLVAPEVTLLKDRVTGVIDPARIPPLPELLEAAV